MKCAILFFLLLTTLLSRAQQAGYRNIALIDSSRRYKPSAHPGDRLYYRPAEIDCWYPSVVDSGHPIRYGNFIRLFEQRADRFQDDTVYSGLASQMTAYLSAGLGIADTANLTERATETYCGARALPGRFPLIVYLCSFNGMCFENTRLFESLARRGYVVASITSVGRYPGNMTMDPADLKEQAADGLFAITALKKSAIVDSDRIGVIGYSWGGPAACLLAQDCHIGALLSLDGSELHYYGQSTDEDSSFDALRPLLAKTIQRRFPYAYLESGGKQNERRADSLFNMLPAFQGVTKYIRFPDAVHEDFSSLPYLAARIGKADTSAFPDYVGFAGNWMDNWLRNGRHVLPVDSPLPEALVLPENRLFLRAVVLDATDHQPLAYVNVGIQGKNIGTVTGEEGSFHLAVPRQLKDDSLLVSMAGYEPRRIPLRKARGAILLSRLNPELTAAVVTETIRRTKFYGNSTTSRMVQAGFPLRFLGAEMAVRVSLGKKRRRLEKFHCHVTHSPVDSTIFRVNIYRMVKDSAVNMLRRNVLLVIRQSAGDYTADLSGLNLVTSGDVLISLELLRSYPNLPRSGAIFFSAALFNAGTYRRPTSQAAWRKANGIGVGFNIEVR